MRAFAFAALLFMGLPALAADKDRIVGTWKLVSVVYEDAQTKEKTPVLGEHPRGYQIATPEGRWLALVTADERPVPRTDEDRAKALRSMIAYSGRYRVEDGKVITKVEVAWNEAWVGGEQIRFLRFEGDDILHIESPPMPHPSVNNKVVRGIVTWARPRVHRHVPGHGEGCPRRRLRRDRGLVRDAGEGRALARESVPEGARRPLNRKADGRVARICACDPASWALRVGLPRPAQLT